ncbi:MAG: hypothetical protein PF442_03115 [Desulfobulbaceae bacterium]|jgi:hypothetical protein|nr:hypothetical protein [Desulfobulbaceae bacterium]
MNYNYCLIFLALLPIATFHISKIMMPSRVFSFTAAAVGLVIAPVSQGMVEFTLIPLIGVYFGFIGGVLNMIHGSVGYFFLGALGVFEAGTVLTVTQLLLMNMVNGVIWISYYSFVGYRMDLKLSPQAAVQQFILSGHNLQHGEEF